MRRIGYRNQRTITRPVSIHGDGLITGSPIHLHFRPAPADTGVIFIRTDLPDRPPIPARVDMVTSTDRRTTLGEPPYHVTLVEHVLATLAGLRIDNCYVELDGPEPPGFDGSAQTFADALLWAGPIGQSARRGRWTVTQRVIVEDAGATLAIYPGSESVLRISYQLDYGYNSPIPPQTRTCTISAQTFINELSRSRTFLLDHEAQYLRAQGIGRHLTPRDMLVFGSRGPIDNSVRFADEPARHKILDCLGDLSLCGRDLVGHIVAYRSGHPLNVALARTLAPSRLRSSVARSQCVG